MLAAILPTTQQLVNTAWAYGFIAATACGLLIAWVILSCLLDRYHSRFFQPPKPPCRIYQFRRYVLSAASMGREARPK